MNKSDKDKATRLFQEMMAEFVLRQLITATPDQIAEVMSAAGEISEARAEALQAIAAAATARREYRGVAITDPLSEQIEALSEEYRTIVGTILVGMCSDDMVGIGPLRDHHIDALTHPWSTVFPVCVHIRDESEM